MASKSQVNLIKSLAQKRNLDPKAVLAVARQEGLGGGIGDFGTSFGPWQLHVGGAFPSGVAGDRQAWAWSPAGLKYALDRIASVAGGLKGRQAVEAIVSRFERPAAPGREIAGALSAYGSQAATGLPGGTSVGNPVNTPLGSTAAPPINANPQPNLLLQAVLSGSSLIPVIQKERALRRLNSQPVLPGLQPQPFSPRNPLPVGNLPAALSSTVPAELLNEGTGGPTHSTGPHIHAAYTNPKAMLAAIHLAQSLGLHVAENPYVGSVAPVHAQNSYHYRDFPGLYGGRKLGEAIDVTGKKAQRFYSLLKKSRA